MEEAEADSGNQRGIPRSQACAHLHIDKGNICVYLYTLIHAVYIYMCICIHMHGAIYVCARMYAYIVTLCMH